MQVHAIDFGKKIIKTALIISNDDFSTMIIRRFFCRLFTYLPIDEQNISVHEIFSICVIQEL